MFVFVQHIVDVIFEYALLVAVLKKEFSKIIEGSKKPDEQRR